MNILKARTINGVIKQLTIARLNTLKHMKGFNPKAATKNIKIRLRKMTFESLLHMYESENGIYSGKYPVNEHQYLSWKCVDCKLICVNQVRYFD